VRERALAEYQERTPDGTLRYTETVVALQAGLKSTTTVRRWVDRAGLPLRGPEGRPKPGKRVLTPGEKVGIAQRGEAGEKPIQIAVALGIGLTTVNWHLQNAARDADTDAQIVALWPSTSAVEIGSRVGLSGMSVTRRAARLSLPARGRGWKSRADATKTQQAAL
jgi:hypothetical protein